MTSTPPPALPWTMQGDDPREPRGSSIAALRRRLMEDPSAASDLSPADLWVALGGSPASRMNPLDPLSLTAPRWAEARAAVISAVAARSVERGQLWSPLLERAEAFAQALGEDDEVRWAPFAALAPAWRQALQAPAVRRRLPALLRRTPSPLLRQLVASQAPVIDHALLEEIVPIVYDAAAGAGQTLPSSSLLRALEANRGLADDLWRDLSLRLIEMIDDGEMDAEICPLLTDGSRTPARAVLQRLASRLVDDHVTDDLRLAIARCQRVRTLDSVQRAFAEGQVEAPATPLLPLLVLADDDWPALWEEAAGDDPEAALSALTDLDDRHRDALSQGGWLSLLLHPAMTPDGVRALLGGRDVTSILDRPHLARLLATASREIRLVASSRLGGR